MSFLHTLENDIKNLQLDFTQLLTSECYYNTSELINHIKHIINALDNIKLDDKFQHESKNWAKQFDSNEMKLNETNIKQLILKGNDLAQQLKNSLHINIINTKEQNQIRIIHNSACDLLLDYLQALHPYASSAYARLDDMAHHLGVTDRFVGYRNNLTRYGNQPVDVHTIWADRKLPTPDWRDWSQALQHTGPAVPTFQPSSDYKQRVLEATEIQHPITTTKSTSQSFDRNTPMSRSGTVINYPGQTETFERYIKPQGPSYSPSLAVAQPDYTSIGRPLSRLVPAPHISEYSESYVFPDASKIERYPWLRP